MSPLEIRIILYAVGALIFGGSIAWGAVSITSHHYERIMAADKLAQDEALQDAQQKVIAAQAEREKATQQVQKAHDLGGLSAAMGNPGQSGGAASSPGGPAGSDPGVAKLNAAIERAVQACQHDSAELAGILALAPH